MSERKIVVANTTTPVNLNQPVEGQVIRVLRNGSDEEEWYYRTSDKWVLIDRTVELPEELGGYV